MSEPENSQQEPTMEEILASIRRIISEDGDDEAEAEPQVDTSDDDADMAIELAAEPEPEPEADDGEEISFEEAADDDVDFEAAVEEVAEDDILELTQKVDEPEIEPEPELEPEPEPEPEPMEAAETEDDDIVLVDPDDGPQGIDGDDILSADAATAASAAFGMLSRQMAVAHGGSHTVEDLVSMQLKPLLKAWLDQHLPDMVERLVKEEIKRLTK